MRMAQEVKGLWQMHMAQQSMRFLADAYDTSGAGPMHVGFMADAYGRSSAWLMHGNMLNLACHRVYAQSCLP